MLMKFDSSEKVWESPDGQKKIFALVGSDGSRHKTYDAPLAEIAAKGGEAQVSQKKMPGKGKFSDRMESFLSLARESGGRGDAGGAKAEGGGTFDDNKNRSMALSYAKDLVCSGKEASVDKVMEVARILEAYLKGERAEPAAKTVEKEEPSYVGVLRKHGLLKKVQAVGVTEDTLGKLWNDASYNESAFIEKVVSVAF